MIRTLATGAVLIVLGFVLAALGVHQLGVVRAARKWPAARQPRVGRTMAGSELTIGILIAAAGAVLLTTLLEGEILVRVAAGAAAGLVVLVGGLLLATKVADRVELNALIRSPSPLYRTTAPGPGGSVQTATGARAPASPVPPEREHRESDADPAVPPGASPGWVFTDPDGGWYLCVAVERGARLVALPEFRLVPPTAGRRLTVAGTVELSVWPLASQEVSQ